MRNGERASAAIDDHDATVVGPVLRDDWIGDEDCKCKWAGRGECACNGSCMSNGVCVSDGGWLCMLVGVPVAGASCEFVVAVVGKGANHMWGEPPCR